MAYRAGPFQESSSLPVGAKTKAISHQIWVYSFTRPSSYSFVIPQNIEPITDTIPFTYSVINRLYNYW